MGRRSVVAASLALAFGAGAWSANAESGTTPRPATRDRANQQHQDTPRSRAARLWWSQAEGHRGARRGRE